MEMRYCLFSFTKIISLGDRFSSVPIFIFPDCINSFPESINQGYKVDLALRHENKGL